MWDYLSDNHCTGRLFTLFPTTLWHQKLRSVLVWGTCPKMQPLFWCQREAGNYMNGHPVIYFICSTPCFLLSLHLSTSGTRWAPSGCQREAAGRWGPASSRWPRTASSHLLPKLVASTFSDELLLLFCYGSWFSNDLRSNKCEWWWILEISRNVVNIGGMIKQNTKNAFNISHFLLTRDPLRLSWRVRARPIANRKVSHLSQRRTYLQAKTSW